uniref:Lipopolysaccharide-induced tumor necrosis factor-alpha factor homolog n=1 Tax=Schistosoma japonicum TaxID=6182 RepID=C1L6B9_SCHJA|nr:Lipopolysaccharide-induced tumor necrosis factor-alpha factor homolog [Schistosoma japonicum]
MDKPPPPYSPPSAPYPTQTPYSSSLYPQSNQPVIGFVGSGYQYPTPPTYNPPPTTVIVHQPTIVAVAYRRSPVSLVCPHCGYCGMTRVRLESGCLPWLLCGIMCFFGLFWGCCLIPFCLDSTKSARHFCPACNHQVGFYSPM